MCGAWVFEFPAAPSQITANRVASNTEIYSLTVSETECVKSRCQGCVLAGGAGARPLPVSFSSHWSPAVLGVPGPSCLSPLSASVFTWPSASVSVCPLLLLQGCQSLDLRTSSGLDHVCKDPLAKSDHRHQFLSLGLERIWGEDVIQHTLMGPFLSKDVLSIDL